MKCVVVFVLGVLAGAFGLRYYELHEAARASAEADLARWHLAPGEVQADLARTGEVVRSRALAVGGDISDVRIAAVIKAKYVLDRDLSATDIHVECRDGSVDLDGTVSSPELVGRAVMLALETDGVRHVTARLAVRPRA